MLQQKNAHCNVSLVLLPQVMCLPQKAQGTAAQMLQQCWEQMAGAVQGEFVQCCRVQQGEGLIYR
jgi:hypothetical protein